MIFSFTKTRSRKENVPAELTFFSLYFYICLNHTLLLSIELIDAHYHTLAVFVAIIGSLHVFSMY